MKRKLQLHFKMLLLVVFGMVVVVFVTSPFYKMEINYDIHDIYRGVKREDCVEKSFLKRWPDMKVKLVEDVLRNLSSKTTFENVLLNLNNSSKIMKNWKNMSKPAPHSLIDTETTTYGVISKAGNKSRALHKNGKFNFKKFLSEPILTPFNIKYRINSPRTHCMADTNILIAVPSAPGNIARRQMVRNSNHSAFAKDPRNRAKMVFFLGSLRQSLSPKRLAQTQQHIDMESYTHDDIVQATFVDEYQNLTKKASLFLHWASKYCKNAKYFLRVDDDVKINVEPIIEAMEIKSQTFDNFILGQLKQDMKPVRNPKSIYAKYLVPETEWPKGELYPPFLLGGAYGFPMTTAGMLLEAMRRTKVLWLDDVFVTGVCAVRVGIPVFNDYRFVFQHQKSK